MAGCCGGTSKRVTVEFEYLVVDGSTCDRCGDSRAGVRAAVADALTMLPQLDIKFVEHELSSDRLADSNRVLINGLPAEEWLGGQAVISDCPSCATLVGEPACCREVEVGGVRTEAISRELVLDAILAAAGLAPAGVPGENCCGTTADAAGSDAASAGGPPARGLSSEDSKEGPDGSAGCGCAAPPRQLSVTLVTGPGCG